MYVHVHTRAQYIDIIICTYACTHIYIYVHNMYTHMHLYVYVCTHKCIQLFLKVGLPGRLIQRCSAALANDNHPLHQPLQRTFEKLSNLSMSVADLRYVCGCMLILLGDWCLLWDPHKHMYMHSCVHANMHTCNHFNISMHGYMQAQCKPTYTHKCIHAYIDANTI